MQDLHWRWNFNTRRFESVGNDARVWWHADRFPIEHNYHWFRSGNMEKSLLDPIINQLNHKY